MSKAISDNIKQIIFEVSKNSSFSIDIIETDQDHIHILLNITPQFTISSIVNRLKSISTYRIWKLHYEYLKQQFWKENTFWSDGYFVCSIGEANADTIRRYIETQGVYNNFIIKISWFLMEDVSNYWDNSKYQYCAYAERLLKELILLNEKVKQPINMYEVKKGIYYAKKYHGSQMRQSGEPYYSHPIEVAYMLAQYTALEIPRLFRTDILEPTLL